MASNTTTLKRDPYAELPPIPSFSVESSVVAEGETMPIAQRDGIFDSGGRDTSPDLTWSGFPNETQSFIVTMYDPDAPSLRRYIGAGPPPGYPPHRYFIAVTALDIAEAGVPATATPAFALFYTRANTLGRAMLVPRG
jgi:phosphatidylethanolamine-binding protein (PEBP) family uncharacterized protein